MYSREENCMGRAVQSSSWALRGPIRDEAISIIPGLDDEQFEMEHINLACLQHHNIAQLVGYCLETWREYVICNGKINPAHGTKRELCLEYMCNVSLDKYSIFLVRWCLLSIILFSK